MARTDEGTVSYRTLHSSALVRVRDYACRAARSGPERLEASFDDVVVLMRRGTFSRHFGTRRSATADVNQAAFFSKGSEYRVSHSGDGGDRGTVFEVAPRILRDFVRELDPRAADGESALPFPTGPCDTRLFWRHRELVVALENAEAEPLEHLWADATALQLVADVLEAAFAARGGGGERRREGTEEDHAARVEAVKALLAARLSERVTLAGLAEAVHVSPFHLARLFRERTGVPIHRYLTRLRLRASLERLAEGEKDLTGLAVELGFASHSHFADAFRREFACPPSRVRRASRRELAEMSKIPEA